MDIFHYLSDKTISFGESFNTWQEYITYAGELLEKEKFTNHKYTEDMIKLVYEEGPYIVVTPGLALAHARPNGNVNKNSMSLVVSKKGVKFGHDTNDPVYVLFAIAACSDDEHLKLFQAVAEYLSETSVENIIKAKRIDDLSAQL